MVYTNEQLDAALLTIARYDPQRAEQVAQQLDDAAEEGDVAFTALAAQVVQIADSLARDAQPAAQPKPKAAQPKPIRVAVPVPPLPASHGARRVLGVAALLFGVPLWVVGAHYTLDGWTLMVNVVLELVRSGIVLPLATGVWALLLVPIGVVYSIGERVFLPLRKAKGRWLFLGWGVLLVWLLVNGTDLGSTYLGIATPGPSAWPITKWMAANLWAKLTWMLVVTYVPEVLLTLGWRWARGR